MKFTVTEAIEIAQKKFSSGDKFTLPSVYDDWKKYEFGKAGRGLFGIQFDRYVDKANCGIKRIGRDEDGDALYQMI